MGTRSKRFSIRQADPALIDQVRRIAESPAGETPEVREQLATLAKAIAEVADHCSDLDNLLAWLSKNVTFPASG